MEAFIWTGSGSFVDPFNWDTDPFLIGGPKEQPDLPIIFGPVPTYLNGGFTGYDGSGEDSYLTEDLTTYSHLTMFAGYGNELVIDGSTYTVQNFEISVTPGSRVVDPSLPDPVPFEGDADLYNSKITLKSSTLNSNGVIGVDYGTVGTLQVSDGESTLNGNIDIGYSEGSIGELIVDSGASLIMNGEIYARSGDVNIQVDGKLQINDYIRDDYSGLGKNTIQVGDGGEFTLIDYTNIVGNSALSESAINIDYGGSLKKVGEYNSAIYWDVNSNGEIEVAQDSNLLIAGNLNSSGNLLVGEGAALSIYGGFEGNGDSEIVEGDNGRINISNATLIGDASISLNGGILNIQGLRNEDNHTLTLYGNFSTASENTGGIEGNIHNAADIILDQYFRADSEGTTWRNLANSAVTIVDTVSFSGHHGTFFNDEDASLIVTENATLAMIWKLENDGLFKIEKGGYVQGDVIENSGTLLLEDSATIRVNGTDSNITSSGLIQIDLGASLYVYNAVIGQSGAEFKVNGHLEADVVNSYDGLLSGSGIVHSNVHLYGGTISPGNSPGTLQILGDLTLGDDSEVNFEIAGLADGLFDQLYVRDNLYLGNDVIFNISFLDNFLMKDGDIFDLFIIDGDVFGDHSSIIFNLSTRYFFDFKTYFDNGMFYLEILSDGVLKDNPTANVPEPRVTLIMLLSILLLLFNISLRKEN